MNLDDCLKVFKKQKVTEHKAVLVGAPKIFDCEAISLTDECAVVLYRLPRTVDVEGILMPEGTLSFGYFWINRYFNVYHFVTQGEGGRVKTLGFYFNLSDSTRIVNQQIHWRDLIVDILVTPDGQCQVLDEEEIPPDLPPDLLQLIEEARAEVLACYQELIVELKRSSEHYWRLIHSTA